LSYISNGHYTGELSYICNGHYTGELSYISNGHSIQGGYNLIDKGAVVVVNVW
jgi:hypothetical protein